MYWSQTESSKWSLDSLSFHPRRPFTGWVSVGCRRVPSPGCLGVWRACDLQPLGINWFGPRYVRFGRSYGFIRRLYR
eukprot:scaffold121381_cov63-Phaeocystis_antarctica.AAC.1